MQPPSALVALAFPLLVAACSSRPAAPLAASPSDAARADAAPASKTDAHDARSMEAASDATNVADAAYPTVCNGHAELCGRTYDKVAFPGTHGSYAATSQGFMAPDQTYGVARQLADGIRVLHFEVHVYESGVYVCHSLCLIGSLPFSDEMTAVAAFLAANPDEVVTLLLERSDAVVTADDIGDAIEAAGLASSMHVQAVGAPWPTLGAMIQRGQRLVALLDDPTGSSYSWLLPRWQLTWETPWNNTTPADFGQCDADRGTMGDGIYVVDTYLEDQVIETVGESARVNYDPFLIDRLLYCQRATSTLPNFAMVNFYEVSDLFAAVDVLNGFSPAPAFDASAFPPVAWPGDGGADAAIDAAQGDAMAPGDAAHDG